MEAVFYWKEERLSGIIYSLLFAPRGVSFLKSLWCKATADLFFIVHPFYKRVEARTFGSPSLQERVRYL